MIILCVSGITIDVYEFEILLSQETEPNPKAKGSKGLFHPSSTLGYFLGQAAAVGLPSLRWSARLVREQVRRKDRRSDENDLFEPNPSFHFIHVLAP